MKTFEELKSIIEKLPMVKSVKVPTEPTGFYTGNIVIHSTESNWKNKIIDQCRKVFEMAKYPIGDVLFSGYYGEEPKEGNEYYIQIRTVTYSDIVKDVTSGRLD